MYQTTLLKIDITPYIEKGKAIGIRSICATHKAQESKAIKRLHPLNMLAPPFDCYVTKL